MDREEAVRQFIGDRPAAGELQEWRETLERRVRSLERDRARGGPDAASLGKEIDQLTRQLAALREEEAITRFVEDSVRVTLAMGAAYEAADEFHGLDSEE